MKIAKFFLLCAVGLTLSLGGNRASAQTDLWQQTNGPFGGDVRAFVINANKNIFAATADGGVFRSTDNGGSWARTGLTITTVTDLAINSRGLIFAGTQKSGVLRSTDNGATWTALNSGLMTTSVAALATNARGDMFAGTGGNGVFSSQFTTGVKENVGEIPRAFMLAQNHPNPFNPSTVIKYELPQAVDVQLAIWDLTGRRVRKLVQQQQPAGRYAITWDGRNEQGEALASGVYLYQLRAGDPSAGSGRGFVQTRRMALVR
jgi:hypothetical protein